MTDIGAAMHRIFTVEADRRVAESIRAATETIIRGLGMMTAEERRGVFAELRKHYCLNCGDPGRDCPCENDE